MKKTDLPVDPAAVPALKQFFGVNTNTALMRKVLELAAVAANYSVDGALIIQAKDGSLHKVVLN